jgi:hypothetical protein
LFSDNAVLASVGRVLRFGKDGGEERKMRMKNSKFKSSHSRLMLLLVLASTIISLVIVIPGFSRAGASSSNSSINRVVPSIDPALTAALRQPTGLQLSALNQFKGNYGNQAVVRWNPFSGSPDVMMSFHTAPSTDTPENTARAFVNNNSALCGVNSDALVLIDQKEAMGGYLVRFQQRYNNLDVAGASLGFLMNTDKQIRMVMGPAFRDVSLSTANAGLDAATAIARAQSALGPYQVARPANADQLLAPAFDRLQKEIAPALRAPTLNIVPTADGYRLAWNVITFSRNPFGVFISQVDASNGQILARENKISYQQDPLSYQGDIYPNHPILKNPDTGELALDANGEPAGLKRVQLRGYNPGTNATSTNGTMTGPHALVDNVLATKQPFTQGALGTYFFRTNNAPIEGQPNEADDLAEPSEHIDEVNIFFFINYLIEYIDDLHRRDDLVHNPIGQGTFPDNYTNSDKPLVGLPHFPNAGPGLLGGPIDTTSSDSILRSTLGFDNAFSLNLSQNISTPAGPQQIIINPTVYGHGYLFNDLGKDGAVCYHEGTHSIFTPLVGFTGAPEGPALNEAQADLWAYTITDAEAIGEYVVQGSKVREQFRQAGRDPDSLAWIRSVHTSLKYSQLGTRGNPAAFEEHRDGEIYVGAMWDLRDLMKAYQPQLNSVRPSFIDGTPTRRISLGQESWERIYLGSEYVLSLSGPDTFVKFRDAVIQADRILYPTDPSDLEAPGQHEALIWQVFASHELGANAEAPTGGRQTISTQVPQFASDQAHTSAPQGLIVDVASQKSLRVSWQPVDGAFAYEVFKRKIGSAGQRQFKGITGREYFDGDEATTGWSHVAYVHDANSYEDKGFIAEFYAPAGLSSTTDAEGFNEMLETEYAVRALSINPNKQAGVSDLSGSAALNSSIQDITPAIQTSISNVSLSNGTFSFDETLKNNGVSAVDKSAYSPINFKIVRISNPTVTVANADNGGNGQSNAAVFVYNQTLAAGSTSTPRRLVFNDPQAQMFTFDAVVTAFVRGTSIPANGSQPGDGTGSGSTQPPTFTSVTDTYTGTLVIGSAGSQLISGVDYVDVPFIAKPNSFGVQGVSDASPVSAGVAPDFDLELLDDQGNVLISSGNLGPNEEVGAGITPGKTYVYRVIGYASLPTQFKITSTQFINGTTDGSTGSSSAFLPAIPGRLAVQQLVRFTVNPLTRTVTAQIVR